MGVKHDEMSLSFHLNKFQIARKQTCLPIAEKGVQKRHGKDVAEANPRIIDWAGSNFDSENIVETFLQQTTSPPPTPPPPPVAKTVTFFNMPGIYFRGKMQHAFY